MTTHSTKIRGHKPNLKGEQFGNLMVIKKLFINHKGQHWLCQCINCQREHTVVTTRLLHLNGKTGCRRCSNLKSPCGDLTQTFWHQVRYSAKLGNRKLEITMQEAWDLFLKQERKCALTGIELMLSSVKTVSTASIDRIDSNGHYTLDNIQWVHKDINCLKSNFPQDKFFRLCNAVADYNKV